MPVTRPRPHVFVPATELGPHVCAVCELGRTHSVHPAPGRQEGDVRSRYEVDRTADREEGMRQAAAATDPWWLDCADRAIRQLARAGHPFQSSDAEALGVPPPANPNWWGALMSRLARKGVIRPVSAAPSKRPTVRGSLCREWIGTEQFRRTAL